MHTHENSPKADIRGYGRCIMPASQPACRGTRRAPERGLQPPVHIFPKKKQKNHVPRRYGNNGYLNRILLCTYDQKGEDYAGFPDPTVSPAVMPKSSMGRIICTVWSRTSYVYIESVGSLELT
jgi:hypothetical protein